jgi:opacity protein-like surface antigen
MKIKTILSVLAIITIANCFSQVSENNSIFNFGIGLGSYYTSGTGFKTVVPPIEGSYEYMITEEISIGGFLGLYKSRFKFESPIFEEDEDEIDFNYFHAGALGNYHFVNNETFNVYAGARLGYLNATTKAEDDPDDLFSTTPDFKSSGVLFGVQIGARYFVSQTFAINAELGYGISIFKVGASLLF